MIDEYTTFLAYGYTSDELTCGSGKLVYCLCDDCGKGRLLKFQIYRDLCNQCRSNTKSTKEKQSKAQKERIRQPHTEETKIKMRKSAMGKKGTMKGKKHTEESKKKMRESLQRHHVAYDFHDKDALVTMVTSSQHSKIHSPAGISACMRGYSLID